MTALQAPSMVTVANIHTEMENLGVPMAGWWWEPHSEDLGGDPTYGMTVAPEALADSDATSAAFVWTDHGWTLDDACDGMGYGPHLLDISDPYDPAAVAARFKASLAGEGDFLRVPKETS